MLSYRAPPQTVQAKSQKLGATKSPILDGKEGVVRTSFKLGATLPVNDGQVVTPPPEAAKS